MSEDKTETRATPCPMLNAKTESPDSLVWHWYGTVSVPYCPERPDFTFEAEPPLDNKKHFKSQSCSLCKLDQAKVSNSQSGLLLCRNSVEIAMMWLLRAVHTLRRTDDRNTSRATNGHTCDVTDTSAQSLLQRVHKKEDPL